MIHDHLTSLLSSYQNFLKSTQMTSPRLFLSTDLQPTQILSGYIMFTCTLQFP